MLPFKNYNKIAELDVLSDNTKLLSQLFQAFDLFVDGKLLRSFWDVKKRGYKFTPKVIRLISSTIADLADEDGGLFWGMWGAFCKRSNRILIPGTLVSKSSRPRSIPLINLE